MEKEQIIKAFYDNDLQFFQQALKSGLHPSYPIFEDNNLFMMAVISGWYKLVKLFLEHQMSTSRQPTNPFTCLRLTNQQDDMGRTPLMHAIKNNHFSLVCLLIKFGANVNQESMYKYSAIHYAVQKHYQIVQVLLGINCSFRENKLIPFAKEIAEINAYRPCFSANPNLRIYDGKTALHLAVKNGQRRVVQLLLESNSQIDAQDQYGNTPLMIAVEKGYQKVVRMLLEQGANPHIKNKKHESAQDMISINDGYKRIMRMFRHLERIRKNYLMRLNSRLRKMGYFSLIPPDIIGMIAKLL